MKATSVSTLLVVNPLYNLYMRLFGFVKLQKMPDNPMPDA